MLSGTASSTFSPAISPAMNSMVGAYSPASSKSDASSKSPNDASAPNSGPRNSSASVDDTREASSERVNRASFDRESINGLASEEVKLVRELASRDREVRAHEQAHANVGGRYAGSPTYSFQRGPDGKQYAVGGEVSIDVSPVPGDPQATIEKARIVRRAALAPAEPSAQDRAVAAEASAIELQAKAELLAQGAEARSAQTGPESGPEQDSGESVFYRPIDTRA